MIVEIIKEHNNIEISLVIGCIQYDLIHLKKLLNSLYKNIDHITEIICVISNIGNNKHEIYEFLEINEEIKNKTKLILVKYKLFPGAARNYGINLAKFSYIAFLDVRTLPESNWLENAKNLLQENQNEGLLGKTKYIPNSNFEKCFIASTYGLKTISTLPGSLFSLEFIEKVGLFIPNIRSSEDREWISRAKKYSNVLENNKTIPLSYRDLKDKKFSELLKKWYFYYDQICIEKLSIYNFQRFIYISFFAIATSLFIYPLVVTLISSSTFFDFRIYLKNSFLLMIFLSIYFLLRFLVLPTRKGFILFKNSFFDFINIIFISILIDLVKTFVYFKATLRTIWRRN